jgi:hypothetical protein
MPAKRKSSALSKDSTATIGFEPDRGMPPDEMRMTNRACLTSTFEIQRSKFARLWFLAKNKNASTETFIVKCTLGQTISRIRQDCSNGKHRFNSNNAANFSLN